VSVVSVDEIEILVGNSGLGGQRGTFWVNNSSSAHIPAANGSSGNSTIVNFLAGGSVVNSIEASGGLGGDRGNWPGALNQPLGSGGKGGFLTSQGISASDGFSLNNSVANFNGQTGYGEVSQGPGQPSPFENQQGWFNVLGFVSIYSQTSSSPWGTVFLGGRGGDGESYSGAVPFGLNNLPGSSIGVQPSFWTNSSANSGGFANWVSGGAGGAGGSNLSSHDNNDLFLRGWIPASSSECSFAPNNATWCNHGGGGGTGGPGFVQLSW
jgi:hypothetical protein